MTEIAGIGALNAGLIRAAVQNEEQQVAQQQAQRSDQDGQELAQRRIEQARGGSSDNELGIQETKVSTFLPMTGNRLRSMM